MSFSLLQLLLICSLFVFHPKFILCYSSMQVTRLGGNETDRMALLAIKAEIEHNPNQVLTSWNHSIHFCLWQGVTCGGRRHPQRVTTLDLSSQGLFGSISPHIGNLSFLRKVYLYNNSFGNEIPPQVGRLRRLQELSLMNNSFTGHIPANISNCFNLLFIQLARNKLVGEIPSRLGFLSNLRYLSLGYNNLTGEIPSTVGNLTSLTSLYLVKNNMVGSIPASLGKLKDLTVLSLSDNRLSGTIPHSLHNLSSIQFFAVAANQLQGSIPSYLSDAFPKLQTFLIWENQFTGVIPFSISNATNLWIFQVHLNYLTGKVPNLQKIHKLGCLTLMSNHLGSGKNGDLSFVSDLINATQLRRLLFRDNNFGGALPTSISNLTANLEMLWAGANNLNGRIPSGLGNLVNLQVLDMMENSFTGNIPRSIGKLSSLVTLYLHDNNLTGSIPSTLGNLTSLTILTLQSNNLHGDIPLSLGKCHRLLRLELSQNQLAGRIPQQLLTGVLSLTHLNLSSNHFVGSLPVEIGKMKMLGTFDVSDNMISEELPSGLGSCESLEVLLLQGNSFNGPIPSTMTNLRGLQELDLSRNNFSGDIPKFLEGFKLVSLNLSFNNFVGAVPVQGVFKNSSAISVDGNTKLCGGIADLHLPACNSKRGGLSRNINIVISLVSGFFLLGNAMILYFYFLRKKKKAAVVNNLARNSMVHITYAALVKATCGFSSTNLIGTGAFGSVYKGVWEDDKVVVAVKVLNMLHRGASKSFMAECEALRNIRHRNLVKIITACSSIDFHGNDFKALVYEFMDNGSLDDWLHPSTGNEKVEEEPKVLNLVQRLNISIDVACAMDYLHSQCETPIAHCDLKPSNVLLDKEMTGHVSDFGLARFLPKPTHNSSGKQSSSIGLRGSVGYVAPEYGMGSEVSTNGDIYSFGILLLEMFTGKRPTDNMFNGDLNLHTFVKMTPPECILDIADILVLQGDTVDMSKTPNQSNLKTEKVEKCLNLIFEIGIVCSSESPTNRKDMSDVVSELNTIKTNLLA